MNSTGTCTQDDWFLQSMRKALICELLAVNKIEGKQLISPLQVPGTRIQSNNNDARFAWGGTSKVSFFFVVKADEQKGVIHVFLRKDPTRVPPLLCCSKKILRALTCAKKL